MELEATEKCCCIEVEKRLRIGLFLKVVGSMIQDYGRLMESAVHLEIEIHTEEEWMRGSRQRSQDVHGDTKDNKR